MSRCVCAEALSAIASTVSELIDVSDEVAAYSFVGGFTLALNRFLFIRANLVGGAAKWRRFP